MKTRSMLWIGGLSLLLALALSIFEAMPAFSFSIGVHGLFIKGTFSFLFIVIGLSMLITGGVRLRRK